MDDLLTYILLIFFSYGLTRIIVFSDLLDFYRHWYLKNSGYTKMGNQYVMNSETPPNPMALPYRALFKVINCNLCTSFWIGVATAVYCGIPTSFWFYGLISVGSVSFLTSLERKN